MGGPDGDEIFACGPSRTSPPTYHMHVCCIWCHKVGDTEILQCLLQQQSLLALSIKALFDNVTDTSNKFKERQRKTSSSGEMNPQGFKIKLL